MSRPIRLALYAAALILPPVAALAWGLHVLTDRDRPRLLPLTSPDSVAMVPRPAIDPSKPTVVVLLGRDLTEITDALGPYEMFARVGGYNVVTAAQERQPTLLTGGLKILPHYSLAELDSLPGGRPAVVVVPNLPNADDAINRQTIDWIRRNALDGVLIHSWCKGAMALAETGLLDGDSATAHWGDIPALEKKYPRITWVRGVRWLDRGQFVMSAGISSGIDASLRVIIRLAGDSVARRVAREIRYPSYQFALDPVVTPYAVRPSDAVLLANAGLALARPTLGLGIYDGIGEFDLSNVYDAHVFTMATGLETVATSSSYVVTAHGLTVFPSVEASALETAGLERVIIPGIDARRQGAALIGVIPKALPVRLIHADAPSRFGLEPVIEDLARTSDQATARFALKRMEYRAEGIRLEGARVPFQPTIIAVALAALGVAIALAAARRAAR